MNRQRVRPISQKQTTTKQKKLAKTSIQKQTKTHTKNGDSVFLCF